MTRRKNTTKKDSLKEMPSAEEVARELEKAESIDDFYGKDGIFARLFSDCQHPIFSTTWKWKNQAL